MYVTKIQNLVIIMKKQNIYIKKFSKIGNIQPEKTIKYFICEKIVKNDKIYGICIVETCENQNYEEIFEHISYNYNTVSEILKFLYENSVGALSFKDIVNDILCNFDQTK